jgi:flavin reductase
MFTAAMAAAASGVTLVTTSGPTGPLGQTVSAMCSVSAAPPLLLVCINRRSPVPAAVAESGAFCVNVLAAHQAHIADTFAGRPRAGAPWDFGCADWHAGINGTPRLPDAVASFCCRLDAQRQFGSHVVLFGLVVDATSVGGEPLLYCRREYGRPAALAA